MSAEAAVLEGRREAEALHIDACTVHRPGAPVTDPVTGVVVPTLTLIYGPSSPEKGKCKIQQTMSQASNPTAGGHSFTVLNVRWDTPVSAGPFRVDDVVTMTASVLDPQLVGRVFRVAEPFHKTGATAQRVRVEEIAG